MGPSHDEMINNAVLLPHTSVTKTVTNNVSYFRFSFLCMFSHLNSNDFFLLSVNQMHFVGLHIDNDLVRWKKGLMSDWDFLILFLPYMDRYVDVMLMTFTTLEAGAWLA